MINILHLDTEGGWGGSSISLFKIIKNLNKENLNLLLFVENKDLFKNIKINVEASLVESLYSFSAKPKINNLKLFLTTLPNCYLYLEVF